MGLGMRARNLDGGSRVSGFEHGVSLTLQVLAGELAHGGFIFHQQDGFVAGRDLRDWDRRLGSDEFSTGRDPRQIDLERRSPAGFAVHPDVAAALLDDAVNGGEAEAGALDSLGGEKRLEDMGLSFGIHAHAGVADGQHHVLARLRWGVQAGIAFVERDIGGLDGEFAALRHGIAGVDRQIHDDLFDLAGIGAHRAQFRARDHYQIDVFADQPGEQFEVFGDDGVQIEDLGSEHLLAAESQKLPGEGGGAIGGIGNLLGRPAHAGVGPDAIQQKFGVAGDDHQQIVEVVGNAAGQTTDGFHFLRLAKLLLEGAVLGDVFGEEFEEDTRCLRREWRVRKDAPSPCCRSCGSNRKAARENCGRARNNPKW